LRKAAWALSSRCPQDRGSIVTFAIAGNASAGQTQIGFGDLPIPREVSSINATTLPANYTGGAVTITVGFEADVAPRPNGSNDGTVTVTDWVQIGRFVSGLDTVSPGSEFQRADCAPRETLGNGAITVTDWVQAGRYVAGLDPVVPVGGPTGPSSFGQSTAMGRAVARSVASSRELRVTNADLQIGQQGAIVIELDSEGNENALGFSLNFDPAKLQFVSASIGDDAIGAMLNVNRSQASRGRLGLAIALPAGQSFAPGSRRIIVLNFIAVARGDDGVAVISFDDRLTIRQVSDTAANAVPTVFANGMVTFSRGVPTRSGRRWRK
jgi:hypothetical protein